MVSESLTWTYSDWQFGGGRVPWHKCFAILCDGLCQLVLAGVDGSLGVG